MRRFFRLGILGLGLGLRGFRVLGLVWLGFGLKKKRATFNQGGTEF